MINFKTLALAALVAASAFAQYSTPMRDIEHQARHAVVVAFTCPNSGDPQAGCSTTYQIPAGYRLAVTQISVYAVGSLGQGYANGYAFVAGSLGGTPLFNYFHLNNYAVTRNSVTAQCFFVVDSVPSATVYGPTGNGAVQLTGYLYKM